MNPPALERATVNSSMLSLLPSAGVACSGAGACVLRSAFIDKEPLFNSITSLKVKMTVTCKFPRYHQTCGLVAVTSSAEQRSRGPCRRLSERDSVGLVTALERLVTRLNPRLDGQRLCGRVS